MQFSIAGQQRQSLARIVAASSSLQAWGLVIAVLERLVLGALLLRVWGVRGFEDWSILFAAASAFGLLDLGLHMTFANGYADAFQNGNFTLFKRRIAVALTINSLVAASGTVIILALANLPAGQAFIGAGVLQGAEGKMTFACLGASFILQTASSAIMPLYRAEGRFQRGLAIEAIFQAAKLAALILAAAAHCTPPALAALYLLGTLLLIAAACRDATLKLDAVRLRFAWPARQELAAILMTAPWFFAQHAAGILLLNVPILILPHIAGSAGAVASFILVRTLINSVRQLVMIVANAVAVELATRDASLSPRLAPSPDLRQSAQLVACINSAALSALFWLAGPFLQLCGLGIAPSPLLILALGIGPLLSGPSLVLCNYLNYRGTSSIGAWSRCAQMMAALACGALARPLGAEGVALGLSFGEAIFAAVYLRAGRSYAGVIASCLLPALGCLLATGTAGFLIHAALLDQGLLGFVASFVMLGLSSAVSILLFARSPLAGWRAGRGGAGVALR